jgi:hypothetical protein
MSNHIVSVKSGDAAIYMLQNYRIQNLNILLLECSLAKHDYVISYYEYNLSVLEHIQKILTRSLSYFVGTLIT